MSTSVRWGLAGTLLLVATTAALWAWRIAESPRHPPAVTITWFAVLGVAAALPVGWVYRLSQWWRASRAPSERISVRLYHGNPRGTYRGLASSAAWVRVHDGHGARFYQRIMWEPWLREAPRGAFAATAQRLRADGPVLITTPDGRRLWWAGRPRPEPSRLEPLKPGPFGRGRRWGTVLLVAVAGAVLTGYLGPVAAIGGASYFTGVVLLYGGSPLTSGPW